MIIPIGVRKINPKGYFNYASERRFIHINSFNTSAGTFCSMSQRQGNANIVLSKSTDTTRSFNIEDPLLFRLDEFRWIGRQCRISMSTLSELLKCCMNRDTNAIVVFETLNRISSSSLQMSIESAYVMIQDLYFDLYEQDGNKGLESLMEKSWPII